MLQACAPLHTPAPQTSPPLQPLPSSHGAVLLAKTQPLTGSQLSVVHRLPSLQGIAAPATQLPPTHRSPPVQTLPSEQAAPLLVVTQPLTGSQLSLVQTLPSSQGTAVPGLHWPAAQRSLLVQALLSVQAALLAVC